MRRTLLTTSILLSLTLSACADREDNEDPAITAWHGEGQLRQIDRAGGEKIIPTILDCRVVTDARNVHYYYRVFGDVKTAQQKDAATLEISNVEVRVDRFVINSFQSGRSSSSTMYGGVFGERANLIVRRGEFAEYSLVGTSETEIRVGAFFSHNPYFSRIKKGESFFKAIRSSKDSKSMVFEGSDLPGLKNGTKIDCRAIAI